MRKFAVRNLLNGVLVPPRSLFDKLPLLRGYSYRLKNLKLFPIKPIGVSIQGLEDETWNDQGVLVNDRDFGEFLRDDLQIIDGEIEVIQSSNGRSIARIECFDASEWELSSDSPDVCNAITSAFGAEAEIFGE